MHKPRVYVDTSVIGGCFDEEFAKESQALLEMARCGQVVLLISDLLLDELVDAPPEVARLPEDFSEQHVEFLKRSDEAFALHQQYLAAGIVGSRWADDALHVALATVAKADLLVSWNFKHIVHYDKVRKFNGVNLAEGYAAIDVRSPREVVQYGQDEDV